MVILVPIALLYSTYAALIYLPQLKESPAYYFLGILIPLIANFLWLHSARQISNPESLYKLGVYWDVCVSLSFFLVPIIFFQVRMPALGYLGLSLIISGLIVLKLAIKV